MGNQKDIRGIAELLVNTWKDCYKSFIPSGFLNSLDPDRQFQRHTKYMAAGARYFVAENERNELTGFASYGKNRIEKSPCENELYTMYVRTNDQGKGIGKALLDLVLSDIRSPETSIAVSVFEKNPFRGFYVKNRFMKIDEERIDMGDFELVGEIYIRENGEIIDSEKNLK